MDQSESTVNWIEAYAEWANTGSQAVASDLRELPSLKKGSGSGHPEMHGVGERPDPSIP